MISKELEITIHQAFIEARAKRHEFITVEHILLSLLDNPSAIEALDACGADIESLRTQLATFIGSSTQTLPVTDEVDTQPTLGFQRVIQRAILQVQASSSRDGRKEVLGVNLLGALFGEKNSHAVYYLHQHVRDNIPLASSSFLNCSMVGSQYTFLLSFIVM